jgi:hypothetical protein
MEVYRDLIRTSIFFNESRLNFFFHVFSLSVSADTFCILCCMLFYMFWCLVLLFEKEARKFQGTFCNINFDLYALPGLTTLPPSVS